MRYLVIGPDKPRGSKRRLTNTRVNIRPTSYPVPSMGPIVLVLTLHGWQNQLQKRKADQSAKPVNATVHI